MLCGSPSPGTAYQWLIHPAGCFSRRQPLHLENGRCTGKFFSSQRLQLIAIELPLYQVITHRRKGAPGKAAMRYLQLVLTGRSRRYWWRKQEQLFVYQYK